MSEMLYSVQYELGGWGGVILFEGSLRKGGFGRTGLSILVDSDK